MVVENVALRHCFWVSFRHVPLGPAIGISVAAASPAMGQMEKAKPLLRGWDPFFTVAFPTCCHGTPEERRNVRAIATTTTFSPSCFCCVFFVCRRHHHHQQEMATTMTFFLVVVIVLVVVVLIIVVVAVAVVIVGDADKVAGDDDGGGECGLAALFLGYHSGVRRRDQPLVFLWPPHRKLWGGWKRISTGIV